eukprot:36504-Hanusia_phi.AAC.1
MVAAKEGGKTEQEERVAEVEAGEVEPSAAGSTSLTSGVCSGRKLSQARRQLEASADLIFEAEATMNYTVNRRRRDELRSDKSAGAQLRLLEEAGENAKFWGREVKQAEVAYEEWTVKLEERGRSGEEQEKLVYPQHPVIPPPLLVDALLPLPLFPCRLPPRLLPPRLLPPRLLPHRLLPPRLLPH